MPDLMRSRELTVSSDIEDLLLIQGRIMDAMTEEEYLAPMYIPKRVTKIIFPVGRRLLESLYKSRVLCASCDIFFWQGVVYSRPCPVMVIIANKQYTLPENIDWAKTEKAHSASEPPGGYQEVYGTSKVHPFLCPSVHLSERDNRRYHEKY